MDRQTGIYSLVDNWAHKATRYWVETLSILANLITVGLLAGTFLGYGANLVSFYLVAVLTILAVVLVLLEYRSARRGSYADATRPLHSVMHFLRDTIIDLPQANEAQLASNLERILGDIANVFSMVTRTHCRACIKVLVAAPNTPPEMFRDRRLLLRYLMVRTYARDPSSKTIQLDESADYVEMNTDFSQVFKNPKQRYFFSNDLREDVLANQYKNSHIPEDYAIKSKPWPLHYLSTMVWPIQRMMHTGGELTPAVFGFLCVDSRSRNVFKEAYDFHLGAAIADALYTYTSTCPATLQVGVRPNERSEGSARPGDASTR
jgi:hypothetical protein